MAKKTSFEEALTELEQIVQSMEENILSLEDSVKMYERGVQLAKVCQEKLEVAHEQVKVLQNNLLTPMLAEEKRDPTDVLSSFSGDSSDHKGKNTEGFNHVIDDNHDDTYDELPF